MKQEEVKRLSTKVWTKVTISTEEQNVTIQPTEDWSCIVVETKELDDKTGSPRLYLSEHEMEVLITKMREMMSYVKS